MSAQITIIGLGKIGTSIGLALADETDQLTRIGHDKSMETAKSAEKLGALDKVHLNLHASVENADIVILAVPSSEVRETLEHISKDLKAEAVVIDTSPLGIATHQWAEELIPENRYFLKLYPTINPEFISEVESGTQAANKDLFKKSLMVITSPTSTKSEALQLGADLSSLLGASPFFADPYEFDGIIASSHILPQIISAALLDATTGQPGWQEAKKVAGGTFNLATKPVDTIQEEKSFSQLITINSENCVRVINNMISALVDLRDKIENNDHEGIEAYITRVKENRSSWQNQRDSADWDGLIEKPSLPTSGDMFKNMFGFRLGKGKKGKEENIKK